MRHLRLSFETDYPTVRGGSVAAFNYNVTLKNDDDNDLSVSLTADAPKDITNLGASKMRLRLNIVGFVMRCP